MFSSANATIETNSSGDATVLLSHALGNNPNGFLVEIKYDPGDIDTGADLTITTESGRPILTKANAGTSPVWFMPRAKLHDVADGAEATNASEYIPIKNERIQVVVANGGASKTGSISVLMLNNPPY